jgi:hypothetical protein
LDTIVLGDLSRIHSCSVLKLCSISLYLKQRHAHPSAHAHLLALFLTEVGDERTEGFVLYRDESYGSVGAVKGFGGVNGYKGKENDNQDHHLTDIDKKDPVTFIFFD